MAGPALFTWLQDAGFYRGLHEAAADIMGPGHGRSWLDVGCGPGVLARLAADRSYVARGIDRDPRMIAVAQRLAAQRGAPVAFATADIETELRSGTRYAVVSASSLVVVTPDPAATLDQLVRLVVPGGKLVVIEASAGMTRWRALGMVLAGRLGQRGYMLMPWAMARSSRTVPDSVFERLAQPATRHALLGGLVNAWVIEVKP
jgi:ubiquinone/menaquinone biosynthesis C-methylase UbiE